jgi:electron transfer flavoprotein alpha subunit
LEGDLMANKIWVLAEQLDGRPLSVTLELVSAAAGFARVVEGFTFGENAAGTAEVLGRHGMARLVDLGAMSGVLPAARVAAALAAALADAEEPPDAIFFPTTYDGRDIAARLSAKCDLPVLTNVVGLHDQDGALVTEHAIFGGAQLLQARITDAAPALLVIRSKSFVPAETGSTPALLEQVVVEAQGASDAARVVSRHVDERVGPSLDDAPVVVSGGRGLGDKSRYALIEELATLLHGAPGASRAIVDAGWVPYSHQVGQTGKTVKPDVYIACGISGAMQHLVGMKGSKRIIAINKDESAPIFAIADLSVVGDVTEVLPRLIKALEDRR